MWTVIGAFAAGVASGVVGLVVMACLCAASEDRGRW